MNSGRSQEPRPVQAGSRRVRRVVHVNYHFPNSGARARVCVCVCVCVCVTSVGQVAGAICCVRR